jgi:hypothetical protein
MLHIYIFIFYKVSQNSCVIALYLWIVTIIDALFVIFHFPFHLETFVRQELTGVNVNNVSRIRQSVCRCTSTFTSPLTDRESQRTVTFPEFQQWILNSFLRKFNFESCVLYLVWWLNSQLWAPLWNVLAPADNIQTTNIAYYCASGCYFTCTRIGNTCAIPEKCCINELVNLQLCFQY